MKTRIQFKLCSTITALLLCGAWVATGPEVMFGFLVSIALFLLSLRSYRRRQRQLAFQYVEAAYRRIKQSALSQHNPLVRQLISIGDSYGLSRSACEDMALMMVLLEYVKAGIIDQALADDVFVKLKSPEIVRISAWLPWLGITPSAQSNAPYAARLINVVAAYRNLVEQSNYQRVLQGLPAKLSPMQAVLVLQQGQYDQRAVDALRSVITT